MSFISIVETLHPIIDESIDVDLMTSNDAEQHLDTTFVESSEVRGSERDERKQSKSKF